MKSLLKTALTFIGLLTGLALIIWGGVGVISKISPVAEARGEECAQLETLYGHSTADPIPGLHDAQTSEELDGMARYLHQCWRNNERWDRLGAVQDRQDILESRQLRAAIAAGQPQ